MNRSRRFVVLLLAVALVAPTVSFADSSGAGEGAAKPPSGIDFFFTVRSIDEGASADDVLARLGKPKRVEVEETAPGATKETWFYEIAKRPDIVEAEGPGASPTAEVEVRMVQPLGVPIGFEGAEVFVPGNPSRVGGEDLKKAIDAWKAHGRAKDLLEVAALFPSGTKPSDLTRFLGRPESAVNPNFEDGGRIWGMTYWREGNARVRFQIEATTDMSGASVGHYTGALIVITPQDREGIHMERSAPVDRGISDSVLGDE